MIKNTYPPRNTIEMPWILRWFNLSWALIGNDDDGLYGDDKWRAGREKTLWLAIQWWFRNPFHNLFFYVIGVADRERTVYSFGEWGSSGWSFHVVNWKFLYLPFLSYSGKIDFYIGWRPYGAFGAKLKNGDR